MGPRRMAVTVTLARRDSNAAVTGQYDSEGRFFYTVLTAPAERSFCGKRDALPWNSYNSIRIDKRPVTFVA